MLIALLVSTIDETNLKNCNTFTITDYISNVNYVT